ncbi:DUF6774 domain-containing protein [Anaeromicropila herbilytica]|uniref:DUF6774 domain-containing protein n=1 Tax=Anaeromicropila herbilytica TaxID=2785025 RepID=A0A7R7IEJ6_9FIRM|nr:DUF6774 domain-containing protein [Anaeromicropila herbilytica]BCN32076.1 hypothetical protein bsdtb5_33710 [Anaeromicropila herbilytica]
MNSCEYIAFITAIACTISNCCSEEEVELLADTFSQLGDSLATMLTHNQICSNQNKESNQNNETTQNNKISQY